jgi:hypothetical protein
MEDKLKKFISENDIKHRIYDFTNQVYIYIPFTLLSEFTQLFDEDYFFHDKRCIIKFDCIFIEITAICSDFGFSAERMFREINEK